MAVKLGGENEMREVICVITGITVGGFMGVVTMCMFQIRTINKYEWKIMKLEKELKEALERKK